MSEIKTDNLNINNKEIENRIKLKLYNEEFNDFQKTLYQTIFESKTKEELEENKLKIKSHLYVITKYYPAKSLPEWLREWSKMIGF